MANMELLEKVLTHIKDHPETWYQSMWAKKVDCGTAFCFAGWAVAMTHAQVEVQWPLNGKSDSAHEAIINGKLCDIEDTAIALLGIDEDQADALFCGTNTLDDIERVVKDIANDAQILSCGCYGDCSAS